MFTFLIKRCFIENCDMEGGYKMNIIIEKYDSLDSCPECNGVITLIKEEGEVVCVDCGLVINVRELSFSISRRNK